MNWDRARRISRRDALILLGVGTGTLAAGLPRRVLAQARKGTLVIGLDISDTITLDPARNAQYTPPTMLKAAYDTLVTMTPGDYINLKPGLATSWARTPDGKGWRFVIREGVKFASGAPMTVEDIKWSFERVINLKDQPAQYIPYVERVEIVDKQTIDLMLSQPAEPLLTIIAAPEFVVLDSKLVEQHGGTAAANAKEADKATAWLNSNLGGHRRLRDHAVGAQRADPARAQSEFLARSGAVRAHRHSAHGR